MINIKIHKAENKGGENKKLEVIVNYYGMQKGVRRNSGRNPISEDKW